MNKKTFENFRVGFSIFFSITLPFVISCTIVPSTIRVIALILLATILIYNGLYNAKHNPMIIISKSKLDEYKQSREDELNSRKF